MNGQADVRRVRAHLDRQTDLGDKIAGVRTDDTATDDAVGLRIEQQLGHALVTVQ